MAESGVPTNEVAALQAQVAKLRAELYEARRKYVELAPAKYREFLNGYASLKRADEIHDWVEQVAEQIVAAFMPPTGSPSAELFKSSQRVLCPLCGGSGTHIYGEVGFIYPEGLRRHLTGEVTARQCAVVEAVVALAKNHVDQRGHG